jgi:long-chain acyl-CoA synthetase
LTALIVLDAEVGRAWAARHGAAGADLSDLVRMPELLNEVQRSVDQANAEVSHAEAIRRFRILPVEWTAETGELTPTLKLKRRVLNERYAREIDELYGYN